MKLIRLVIGNCCQTYNILMIIYILNNLNVFIFSIIKFGIQNTFCEKVDT